MGGIKFFFYAHIQKNGRRQTTKQSTTRQCTDQFVSCCVECTVRILKPCLSSRSVWPYRQCQNNELPGFYILQRPPHSNGTIVQGGFITAMLDAAMAHLIILKRNGDVNPLSLNINVNFIAPGSPGEFVAKGEITKMGKSIAFTSGALYQGDTLIATATATNKMIKL